MTENYLAQYHEEDSESSSFSEDEYKESSHRSQQSITEPKVESQSSPIPKNAQEKKEDHDLDFYTFDPKSIFNSKPLLTTQEDSLQDKNSFPKSDSQFASTVKVAHDTVYYEQDLPSPSMEKTQDPFLSDNPIECRGTDEYKGYAKEFEKEFGKNNKEIDELSKELTSRAQRLDGFVKELQGADLDMILFRNKLIREIGDIQNDLKEAHDNILVLMGDRAEMKDQFCLLQVKIKKLNGLCKAFQDEFNSYLLGVNNVFNSRDLAYNKLQKAYEDSKQEAERLRAESEHLKESVDNKMLENSQLKKVVNDLTSECEKMQKEHSNAKTESDRFKLDLRKALQQSKQCQDYMSKLTQSNKVLEQEVKDQASYIEKIKSDNDRLSVEITRTKKLYEDSVNETETLWGQNKDLKSQLNETRGLVEQLNSQVKLLKPQMEDILPENEKLQQIVENAKRKLGQALSDKQKLEQEHSLIKNQYEAKLQSILENYNKYKEETVKLRADNDRLKSEIYRILEGIKKRNEERRKRKEAKMKKYTEEVLYKKQYQNTTYASKNFPTDRPILQKTCIESSIQTPYTTYNQSCFHPSPVMSGITFSPIKTKNSDEEEVSFAFEELMGEVSKYESERKHCQFEEQLNEWLGSVHKK